MPRGRAVLRWQRWGRAAHCSSHAHALPWPRRAAVQPTRGRCSYRRSIPATGYCICLFAHVKNEQNQPPKKEHKRDARVYSLPAFLSPWVQTLAFPILGSLVSSLTTLLVPTHVYSFASGFTFFQVKIGLGAPAAASIHKAAGSCCWRQLRKQKPRRNDKASCVV